MTASRLHDCFAFSQHADTRMAQRGIRADVLDMLLLHGTGSNVGGGCEKYRLLDRMAQQLERTGSDPKVINAARKLIAIVDGRGIVVTCYHAASEIRRHSPRRARPTTRHERETGWSRHHGDLC